jgi:hypothetical protein
MAPLRRWRNATTLIRGCGGSQLRRSSGGPSKKLFCTSGEPHIDASVDQQIACYRRPGFKDPRQKEIERRMRDYFTGRTTKF